MKEEYRKHLQWIYNRLSNVHGEHTHNHIMRQLRMIINGVETDINQITSKLNYIYKHVLHYTYKEDPHVDYMIKLNEIIRAFEDEVSQIEIKQGIENQLKHAEPEPKKIVGVNGWDVFPDFMSPTRTGNLAGVTRLESLDSPKDYGSDSSFYISGNVNIYKQRVIESVKKDIIRNDDGYYVFCPKENGGYYEPHSLRIIADYLDEINKPLDDHINKYFDSFKDEPDVIDDEPLVRGTMSTKELNTKYITELRETPWDWYVSYLLNRRKPDYIIMTIL
jgi:hypothetical protein